MAMLIAVTFCVSTDIGSVCPKAEEYSIKRTDTVLSSFYSGTGKYFEATHNKYEDTYGNICYCLQSTVIGPVPEGTAGYTPGTAWLERDAGVLGEMKGIVEKGYPTQFVTAPVGGNRDNPVFVSGIVYADRFYPMTSGAAWAVTSFAVHRRMRQLVEQGNIAAYGNDLAIGEVNDLTGYNLAEVEQCLSSGVNVDNGISMEWLNKNADGSYTPASKLDPIVNKNGTLSVFVRVSSYNCVAGSVGIKTGSGLVEGASIRDIVYENVFSQVVEIAVPDTPDNLKKKVGISASATITRKGSALAMGHPYLQNLMVQPSTDVINAESEAEWNDSGVKLYKQDKTSGKPVDGCTFGIYSDKAAKNKIGEMTTDKKGYASFGGIEAGTYYIKELKAKNGYIADKTVHRVEVSPGKEAGIELSNTRVSAELTVEKYNSETKTKKSLGDAELSGARYGFYAKETVTAPDATGEVLYRAGELVQSISLDKNGHAVIKDLQPGKYYLKEKTAPKGYKLDEKQYEVDLSGGTDGGETVIKKTVEIYEDEIKRPLTLFKFSEENGGKTVPLKGAGFKAWLVSELKTLPDGSFDTDSAAPVKLNKDGSEELITDDEGYATSAELPYGTYLLRETTVPKGFRPIKDFTVVVDTDSPEPIELMRLKDDKIEAKLKVCKVDSNTGERIALAGFGFKIFNENSKQYVSNTVEGGEKAEPAELFLTGTDGSFTLSEPLEAGEYRLEEVSVPKNSVYALSKNSISFSVSDDSVVTSDGSTEQIEISFPDDEIRGNIIIDKTFQSDERSVAPAVKEQDEVCAVIALYAAEDIVNENCERDDAGQPVPIYKKGDEVGREKLASSGKVSFINLPMGEYIVKELNTLPGYKLFTDEIQVSLTPKDHERKLVTENISITNELTDTYVKKVSAIDDTFVSDAELALYDEDGVKIAGWKTADEAYKVKGLVSGKRYTLVETMAPYGYLKEEEISFVASEENEIVMKDSVPIGRITVDKNGEILKSAKTIENKGSEMDYVKTPLKGTVFALYAAEDIAYAPGAQIAYRKGTEVARQTTDKNGHAVFSELPLGRYLLKELETDDEHKLSPEGKLIELFYVDQYTSVIEAGSVNTNERIRENISIFKIDEETKKPLKGVTFGLYASEDIKNGKEVVIKKGALIEQGETDDEGKLLFSVSLPPGLYQVKELKCPEGYILDEKVYEVELKKGEDTDVNLTIENKRKKIVYKDDGPVPKTSDSGNPAAAVIAAVVALLLIVVMLIRYSKTSPAMEGRKKR